MIKLAFLSLAALIASTARCESYVCTHSKMITEWGLTLPAIVEGDPYVLAGLALEVKQVQADGVVQNPTPYQGVADPDWATYSFPVHAVVYQINSQILVYRWVGGVRQRDRMLVYKLPSDAQRIDLNYVIHLPDGRASKEITLTSYELNALEGRGRIEPNKAPDRTAPSVTLPAAQEPRH